MQKDGEATLYLLELGRVIPKEMGKINHQAKGRLDEPGSWGLRFEEPPSLDFKGGVG